MIRDNKPKFARWLGSMMEVYLIGPCNPWTRLEAGMDIGESEIDAWLNEVTAKLALPLTSKTIRKTSNDVQLGIQLYRSRSSGNFYFEFKYFNDDVCSFGETKRNNAPIFDQRLYQATPTIGEKAPGDFWMAPDDESKFPALKSRLLEQGRSIFCHLRSLEDLLAYYQGERTDVYFEDLKYNRGLAEMWARKIEGYLSNRRDTQ